MTKNYTYEINLQLFAEGLINGEVNGTVTEGSMGTGTPNEALAPQMKVYYDTALIKLAGPNLVYDQFAQKRDIPKGNGKVIEFRQFQPLAKATTPISEGVTPTGKKLTSTAMQAKVDQYGDYVELSDVVQMTSIDPMVTESLELLSDQAGKTLDTITRDTVMGGTNALFSSKVSADGTETEVTQRSGLDATATLKVKDVQKAVAILRNQNAPTIDGQYYGGIIHPFAEFDLMNDPRWEDVQNYADPENRLIGEVGRIAGVRFTRSSEAKIWGKGEGNTAVPVYGTLICGKNAYGTTAITGGGLETIVKQLGYGDDPLNQRSSAGWKATKVAKRLVESYMIRIESAASSFGSVATSN